MDDPLTEPTGMRATAPPMSILPSPGVGADVINTTGLTKTFGGVEALRDLDLKVPEHSIVGFLGPNGAGKTTAIKLLLGLSRPTSGQASLFGLDAVRDSTRIRAEVGYLAQDPRFYTHLTARETLEFTARFFFRGPKAAIRDRIDETLELVGLVDKADRPTKGFSGGERQRLGIAQAQVNHPRLLVLDEPAAALDPLGRRDVLEVMERLRDHTTIFYSTHILDDVQRVSDRVVILHGGRKVADSTTAQLLDGGFTYELTVRGDSATAGLSLKTQPWVTEVAISVENDGDHLTVTVTDQEAADALLLRSILQDDAIEVTAFGRRHLNLEDVFLDLVEGVQA
ncbi:MAG: ABC transporter ATP-binding protein [Acidimicrobiia bacterium]